MPPKSLPALWYQSMQPKATPSSKKRGSSPIEVDDDYATKPVKKARTAKKASAKDVGTCSMTKKEIGDSVKSALALEKYEVQSMRIDLTMDTPFFRAFFVDNASLSQPTRVTPSTFDDSTAVVVVELSNTTAGDILGVSKIKGGNRYATTHLASMSVVFYPAEQRCRLWVTV